MTSVFIFIKQTVITTYGDNKVHPFIVDKKLGMQSKLSSICILFF